MSYNVYTGLLKMFVLPSSMDAKVQLAYDNDHPMFEELRNIYPIEAIAGNGDDFSKAVNLLSWVSSHVYHKGDYMGKTPQNSIALLEDAFDTGAENGVNCVCLAKILSECLLAIGLMARQVFIMPCSPYDGDNHVVTHVYIKSMEKWVMLDPTLNAFITNEKGVCLSLLELRDHLANQEPVFFNKEAKYNDDVWTDDSARENIEYFAKNLFYLKTNEVSTFGNLENANNRCITFAPQRFDVKEREIRNIKYRIKTCGDSAFYQEWLEGMRKEEWNYCSCAEFEASPIRAEIIPERSE